jgi:cytochrome c553
MGSFLKNKRIALFLGLLLISLSCQSAKEEKEQTNDKAYVMYQPSEMALLMQEFYDYNTVLRSQILSGEPLAEMPEDFKAIHTAEMTDASGRNSIFSSYAPAYIQTQKAVLDSSSSAELKERFNSTINMCLACHKTECVGPIPRIKRLLIE